MTPDSPRRRDYTWRLILIREDIIELFRVPAGKAIRLAVNDFAVIADLPGDGGLRSL